MRGAKDDYIQCTEAHRERQIPNDITYIRKLRCDINEHIYETEKTLMDIENRLMASKAERIGGGME